MKYLRSYGWGVQLFYFSLLFFTFFVTASIILTGLIPKIFGVNLLDIESIDSKSSFSLIQIALLVQGASSLFVFLLPGYIFAYLAHPNPLKYLGLVSPGKKVQFLLVILIILGAIPVLQFLEGLIGKINFGASVKKNQETLEEMMRAFMLMPTFGAFLKAFFVMAIIPGFGEEIFFRGVIMRLAKRNSINMAYPIIFTALIFALAHSNIFGFVSIFLAGTLLGVIYYLTGSLWCSIVAHVFFNGLQIIIEYYGNTNSAVKQFMENSNSLTQLLPFVFGGIVLFSVSFYLLLKNKTPLKYNWNHDFTEEELMQLNK